MKIRGIEFGNVFCASGTLNFFGEGWWYHRFFKIFFRGYKKLYTDCTFISKTTTWNQQAGNMKLKKNQQPRSLWPNCIKLLLFLGAALNAVGLSGPGAPYLFAQGIWQKITKAFVISFMAVGKTREERREERRQFIELFKKELPTFRAPIMVQVNKSCPNAGHKTKELEEETIEDLQAFTALGIPISLKVNVLFATDLLKRIDDERLCDIITVSNTIPYGTCAEDINWKKIFWWRKFWGHTSPLHKYGGGGLSGKENFPLVIKKIVEMRQAGITMPIVFCGGVMSARDVKILHALNCVSGFEFATAAMIRPWRVKEIVETGNKLFN